MAGIFQKLNLKGQDQILILNAPDSFEPDVASLHNVRVYRDAAEIASFGFALAFATRQAEINALVEMLVPKAEGDAMLWFAYPKGSSKRYRCDFNRDTGWDRLRSSGFDTVRMVAVDEDWSALRFRRTEFIGR